jgi:hypothetical protein
LSVQVIPVEALLVVQTPPVHLGEAHAVMVAGQSVSWEQVLPLVHMPFEQTRLEMPQSEVFEQGRTHVPLAVSHVARAYIEQLFILSQAGTEVSATQTLGFGPVVGHERNPGKPPQSLSTVSGWHWLALVSTISEHDEVPATAASDAATATPTRSRRPPVAPAPPLLRSL